MRNTRPTARILVFTFGAAVAAGGVGSPVASAQDPASAAQSDRVVTIPAPPLHVEPVNADRLGVSIDRIRLRFTRTAGAADVFDPARLMLSTHVDVVAKAPPLQLFGPDPKQELTRGAVQFGSPTHQEMLNVMTPREFRQTAGMDLAALMEWLSRRLGERKSD